MLLILLHICAYLKTVTCTKAQWKCYSKS